MGPYEDPELKFIVFPSFWYYEIDGKPVSNKEAQYGLHPRAILKETEARRLFREGKAY